MGNFLIFFVVLVLGIAYVVYRGIFKRILHIRKNIVTLVRSMEAGMKIEEKIKQAKENHDFAKQQKAYQEALHEFDVQLNSIDEATRCFLAQVKPNHANEYAFAEALRKRVVSDCFFYGKALERHKFSENYCMAVSTLYQMQRDFKLDLRSGFAWERPDDVMPLNVGELYLSYTADPSSITSQQQSMMHEALEKLKVDVKAHTSQVFSLQDFLDGSFTLPAYKPLGVREDFATVYVLNNLSLLLLMALSSTHEQLKKAAIAYYELEDKDKSSNSAGVEANQVASNKEAADKVKGLDGSVEQNVQNAAENQEQAEALRLVEELTYETAKYVSAMRRVLWVLGLHNLLPESTMLSNPLYQQNLQSESAAYEETIGAQVQSQERDDQRDAQTQEHTNVASDDKSKLSTKDCDKDDGLQHHDSKLEL